jgi:hypothetical protein
MTRDALREKRGTCGFIPIYRTEGIVESMFFIFNGRRPVSAPRRTALLDNLKYINFMFTHMCYN